MVLKTSWLLLIATVGIASAALVREHYARCEACEVSSRLLLPPAPKTPMGLRYSLLDSVTKMKTSLGDLRGKSKYVLVDAFASWCGPCMEVIPEVLRLNSEMKSKGLTVVGLNVSDSWQGMESVIHDKAISYKVLHDESKGGIEAALGIEAVPTLVLFDGATMKELGRWEGTDPTNLREIRAKLR